MRKFIIALSFIISLSGCATTQMVKDAEPPSLNAKTDKAQLIIIRDTFLGSGIVFWNYLDDEFIGETMGKTYFITEVPPGQHYVVSSTENTGVAHFNFESGKRYFLGQGVTMGIWRARTSGFYPMSLEEAQEAMQGCSYLMLDSTKTFPNMEPELYKKAIDEYEEDVKKNPEGYHDLLLYKGI